MAREEVDQITEQEFRDNWDKVDPNNPFQFTPRKDEMELLQIVRFV